MKRRAAFLTIGSVAALAWPSVASGQRFIERPPSDSTVLLDTVVAAENRFFAEWMRVWRISQYSRHVLGDEAFEQMAAGSRGENYHCHPDTWGPNTPIGQGRLIKSDFSFYSVCPSWDLGEVQSNIDERRSLDEVIDADHRDTARMARAVMLGVLDSAARILPGNDFLTGQRVRFRVDQRDLDPALAIARECAGTPWWCLALAGYVHAVRGDVVAADSAFADALGAMPRQDHCVWNNISTLLDSASRSNYIWLSCAKRDSANERIWWLAQPLYLEPGNARRVEQYARRVWLLLHTALDRDERFDWRDKVGGDARKLMVERYGWPAEAVWGGPLQDRGHTGYLSAHVSVANAPYTTYEYAKPRAHTIPSWAAWSDPFHATPTDWNVSEPPVSERPEPKMGPPTVALSGVRTGPRPIQWNWWPAEHFEPARPIVQLPDGQHAILRRDANLLLAVSTQLSNEILRRQPDDTIRHVTLLASERPGEVERIADADGVPDHAVVVTGTIPSRPAVFGLEFAAPERAGGPPAGRLRFGLTPPPTLAAMRSGERAVSDPVLLRAPAGDDALPNDAESALRFMAPSMRAGAAGRMGVYWETYGFQPTDTVEVAVWIERYTSQGIIRRFGIALGVATDLNTPIAMSWREPQAATRRNVIDGPVTIIGRSVILDTSRLLKGDYWLDVAVRKPGGQPVRGRTSFVVK